MPCQARGPSCLQGYHPLSPRDHCQMDNQAACQVDLTYRHDRDDRDHGHSLDRVLGSRLGKDYQTFWFVKVLGKGLVWKIVL
jgi:hypothetical protein